METTRSSMTLVSQFFELKSNRVLKWVIEATNDLPCCEIKDLLFFTVRHQERVHGREMTPAKFHKSQSLYSQQRQKWRVVVVLFHGLVK